MGVTASTRMILAYKSGGRCAKPGCHAVLHEPATLQDGPCNLGDVAHIVSQADTGPRADPTMSRPQRDLEPNLLMLCLRHHRVADRQENTYSRGEMTAWKTAHEAYVSRQVDAAATRVTFVELEIVADAVEADRLGETPGFAITEVREKMAKNALSSRTEQDIRRGMLNAQVVGSYLARRAAENPAFPERLRGGFVAEYDRLRDMGFQGDDLFLQLRHFASPADAVLERQMAGLAVLVHLFRICQVFEP